MVRATLAALTGLALGCAVSLSTAGEAAPETQWITPAIEGYGRVHPRPDLPVRPDPATTYRVFVDVVQVNPKPDKLSFSLNRLARLVNLFAYAGVPREHVHVVALLDESAALLALSDSAYQQRFHVPNPNLEVLRRLKAYGVQLLVCSQAMAEAGIQDNQMSPVVTITLSALTDLAVYGQKGYSYMRL